MAAAPAARADDPKPSPATAPGPKPKPPAARVDPAEFALPGEDPPAAFVPKSPRTVAQQKAIEAIRLYTEARAQEDRGDLAGAIGVLERALAAEPDSVPVLRRLALLCDARGLKERSVEYGRRVLAAEPGDARAIGVVVDYYLKAKRDPAKAIAFLNDVVANPKLDRDSPDGILVQSMLAKLYAGTGQGNRAADVLAKVIDAIDSKAGNRLTTADRRRILGDNEAFAYFGFGKLFLEARRLDLATRCFRRAAVYDEANPQLPLLLAKIYLLQDQPGEALTQLDKALTHRVQDAETFQLLAVVLNRLKRDKELIPRLEAAAKVDPRNIVLRYILADLYRGSGLAAKADALLRGLLAQSPGLDDFDKLFATLFQQKKTEDLLRLLGRAYEVTQRVEMVDPKLDALLADPAFTDAVLDAGLAMLAASPPTLDDKSGAVVVLARLALKSKRDAKRVEILRRVARARPSPAASQDLIDALLKLRRFDEAVAEADAAMAKFPEGRADLQTMLRYTDVLSEAGKGDRAISILQTLLRALPDDAKIIFRLGQAFLKAGRADEAIALCREGLRRAPADPSLVEILSLFLRTAGRTAERVEFLKSIIARDPRSSLAVMAHSHLSAAYTDLGDLPKAEAELELVYANDPDDHGVNNDLGYLWADQGKNLDKAEAMIRKAVAYAVANPNESSSLAAYLDSLGWVLFKRGKFQRGRSSRFRTRHRPWTTFQATRRRDRDARAPRRRRISSPEGIRHRARTSYEAGREGRAPKAFPADKRLGELRKKLDALSKLGPAPKTSDGGNP